MSTRKRLPPFGRQLLNLIASGKNLRHGVAIWIDRQPERGICKPLAVFPDADPSELDWSICRGLDVHVPHADETNRGRLIATVRAIKEAHPRRLVLWKADPPGHEFVVIAGGAA